MQNINLKVEKEEKKENELELKIEADVQFSEKAYAVAYRDIANEINISGFRKGKAPRDVIEKSVGKGYISQKAFEKVFYSLIVKASLQEKLEILDVIKVNSYELLPDKPLTMSVLVELKPKVKLPEYKKRKVKAKKFIYEKEAFIKRTVDKLAQNLITFSPASDRPVIEGDLVNIDFEGKFLDGAEVPGGKAENYQAILEKGNFLPEFIEKLQGAKISEIKEIEITFPDTAGEEYKGRKAVFSVKINGIEEKVLPEINDEFAKKFNFANIDELKEKIVQEMNEMQESNSRNDFETNLVNEIIKDSTFTLSSNMISKEIDYLLADSKKKYEQDGVEWEKFKADEKNKELFVKAKEVAEKRLNTDLVLGAIIENEKFEISNEDLESEVKKKINQLGDKYKHMNKDFRFIDSIRQGLLRNKALDFLVENNEALWEEELLDLNKV